MDRSPIYVKTVSQQVENHEKGDRPNELPTDHTQLTQSDKPGIVCRLPETSSLYSQYSDISGTIDAE